MRFVIVGAGVAGVTAAMDLARRKLGDVIVYSDEEYPYYYRPRLAEFLVGSLPLNKLLRRPLSWYHNRGIQLMPQHPVQAIDPNHKRILLSNGKVSYDKLLLAVGSTPFVPPIRGSDKAGIYTWRTLRDTLTLAKVAATAQDIIVIGGGLLGLEAARGLRSFGGHVTVLEFLPRLMPRQLDTAAAKLLQDFVAALGIEVKVGARCEEILGDAQAAGVRLQSGEEIPAQAILVSAGVRSNTQLAAAAGITVDPGIIVDEHMQTNAPNIFAAGDAAVYQGQNWAIAPIAQAQGRVAAANMAGEEVTYRALAPATSLKVVGIDVSSIGMVNPNVEDDATEVQRLDEDARTYKKIVLQDNRIVGAIVINDKELARELENQIAAGTTMTPAEAERLLA